MSEDRLTIMEERLAALEREVTALRAVAQTYGMPDPNDPLKGYPQIWKRPTDPKQLPRWEAWHLREIDHYDVPPATLEELRAAMLAAGWDPTSNAASREIIAMRGE